MKTLNEVVDQKQVEDTYNRILEALDTGDGTACNLVIILSTLMLLSKLAHVPNNGFKTPEESLDWIKKALDVSFQTFNDDNINTIPN